MITAAALAERMRDLEPIGLSERGTNRLAWTEEDAAAARWFADQAEQGGLTVRRDPAGNLWALPAREPPWWAIGSHLDSVRDGGRFDGALGVAAAFEIADRSAQAPAVISFADEEGARFNTPTFGSRALVGRLDLEDVLARRDDDGVLLRDAMRSAGADPDDLAHAPDWLPKLRGFLELHIDQTTDLEAAGSATGVVRGLASRLRLQVDLTGVADHAGTTRRTERHDALSAAARLIVLAEDLAANEPDFVTTAARILVEPNALTTVPSRVRLWLDARAPSPRDVDAWRDRLTAAAAELAEQRGVRIDVAQASRSAGVEFDTGLRSRLHAVAPDAPELTCFAGHDAGVIAERLPAGMVFVRNPTGISHSPHEQVSMDDAAEAATVMLRALEELA